MDDNYSQAAGPSVPGIPPELDVRNDHERCSMFVPPLYSQRYTTVCELLSDTERYGVISRVLDIGCAEMSFLECLKTVPTVTDVTLLDISEDTLRRYLQRASPGMRDRLGRRSRPLRVRVFCGDVTEPDSRLLGCEAVTGIELIEHLEPAVLQALPATVFSYLRPRLVVLTTPNAEFNQLFPDFSGMRHWDHKFEWSRAEFQQWCGGVVAEYPEYEVSFAGVGAPPAGSEHLGCCSQLAVFVRRLEAAAAAAAAAGPAAADGPQPHRLLSDVQFPFETRETRLYNDVLFWKRQIGYGRVVHAEHRHREELVSLNAIAAVSSVATAMGSMDELVAILRERGEPVVVRNGEPHVVYRAPASSSGSEDELAGGDLRPAETAAAAAEPAGADRAAGDARYHDDWDGEPDWEQEIMERLRLGRAGRPRPGVV